MQYDTKWLLKELDQGITKNYIFFWGDRLRKDGQIGKSCFSQWFARGFEHQGIHYTTAEHWMMAEKARLFKDQESLEKILISSTPGEAKKLGRAIQNFTEQTWLDHREKIVREGNYLKFSQNQDLYEYILSTGDRVLVEASPYDRIWGIGMKQGDAGIEDPNNWKGLNLLGYALMEVRERLGV